MFIEVFFPNFNAYFACFDFLGNPKANIELGSDGQLCQECW